MENEDSVYLTLGRNWSWRQWLLDKTGVTITPYIGALPLYPLRTHIGPRFSYQGGEEETLEQVKSRWFAHTDAMMREFMMKKTD